MGGRKLETIMIYFLPQLVGGKSLLGDVHDMTAGPDSDREIRNIFVGD